MVDIIYDNRVEAILKTEKISLYSNEWSDSKSSPT